MMVGAEMDGEPEARAEEFRKVIDIEVLSLIKKLAEEGHTSRERIQEIARKTLTHIHPDLTCAEVYQNALCLCVEVEELLVILPGIVKEYQAKYDTTASTHVTLSGG